MLLILKKIMIFFQPCTQNCQNCTIMQTKIIQTCSVIRQQ